MAFLQKLAASTRARESIVCVGLDPEPDRIPLHLGEGPRAAVTFLRAVVSATSEHTAAYKPNLAFFEQYGPAGMGMLVETLEAIPDDIPVVLDGKRGDVPNTAAAYARALFEGYRADAVTVSPYLGVDAVAAFWDMGYVFVLARTSNPGARDLQDLRIDGRPLYERVAEAFVARSGAGECGFVVGATYPDEARRLREIAPDRLFLMPGIGAQGGTVDAALAAALDARGGGVLPAASRSILYASAGADYERAAERAVRELKDATSAARSARAG